MKKKLQFIIGLLIVFFLVQFVSAQSSTSIFYNDSEFAKNFQFVSICDMPVLNLNGHISHGEVHPDVIPHPTEPGKYLLVWCPYPADADCNISTEYVCIGESMDKIHWSFLQGANNPVVPLNRDLYNGDPDLIYISNYDLIPNSPPGAYFLFNPSLSAIKIAISETNDPFSFLHGFSFFSSGNWQSCSVAPAVLLDKINNRFIMYYQGQDSRYSWWFNVGPTKLSVGRCTSAYLSSYSNITWNTIEDLAPCIEMPDVLDSSNNIELLGEVMHPCVRYFDGCYYLVAGGNRLGVYDKFDIYMWKSIDGIHWGVGEKIISYTDIPVSDPDFYPSSGYRSSMTFENDTLYLWVGYNITSYSNPDFWSCRIALYKSTLSNQGQNQLNYTARDYEQGGKVILNTPPIYYLKLTSPNGGENWQAWTGHDISWVATGLSGEITIDLYKNGVFDRSIDTTQAANGVFHWNIDPSQIAGNDYKIKISQGSNEDFSDDCFSITPPPPASITITSPNGGENWQAGTYNEISWIANGFSDDVIIDLYKNGVFLRNLGTSSASTGTYNCYIPYSLTAGSDYMVKIYHENIEDYSNNEFSLSGSLLNLIEPNGGQDWSIGATQRISWETSISNVYCSIYLFKGDTLLGYIAYLPITNGNFDWIVGNYYSLGTNQLNIAPEGSDYRIDVACNYNNIQPNALSDDFFTINNGSQNKYFTDFDNNGVADILWRYHGVGADQGKNEAWLMNTDGTINMTLTLPSETDLDWQVAGTDDLNQDGITDIFWRNYGTGADMGKNRVWLMNGNGTLQATLQLTAGTDMNWKIGTIGNLDQDQVPDILWRYHGTGANQGTNIVWYLNSDGSIKSSQILQIEADLNWLVSGIADFDRDGQADILWHYNGTGGNQGWNKIWYMNSSGTIREVKQLTPVTDLNWKIVGVGKCDPDFIPDIIWRYQGIGDYTGWNSIWYLDSTNNLRQVQILQTREDLNWKIVNNGNFFI